MGEIRSTVERIDVPAIVAACVLQAAFFAENVKARPALAQTLSDEQFGLAIGHRNQISLAFVFHGDALPEEFHQ